MSLFPVIAHADFSHQRHIQLGHIAHQARQVFTQDIQLVFGYIEYQFVMYLHHHLRTQPFFFQPALHSHHGHLDQVSRSALHRGVNGGTLCTGHAWPFRALQFR